MSSVIDGIINTIQTAVETVAPTIVKSKNYYDFNKNETFNNAFIYAVRPSSGSPTSGTIRHVTMQQDFELEICKEFIEKDSTDTSIRQAIESIYATNELCMRQISLGGNGNILLIGEPSIGAPEVNQTQKSVSIIFTYPIKYKKQIRGVS